jgi:hypothetical protein
MKRKELYEYIREQIINELTPTPVTTANIGDVKKKISASTGLTGTQKADLTKSATPGSTINLPESDLEEMARTPKNLTLGPKFETAKKLFDKGIKAQILAKVEEMGEEGISQLNLALALGKKSQPEINPYVRELTTIGALATVAAKEEPKAEPTIEPVAIEEPEVSKVEKPESEFFSLDGDEEVDSDEERPTEKEKEEEPAEPSIAAIKSAEKELGSIDTEKVEAANKAAGIVKNLSAKIEGMKKGPEREKKLAALKQYVKNNRKTVLKGFKISDLTNGLVS